jgi:hypothetical protein
MNKILRLKYRVRSWPVSDYFTNYFDFIKNKRILVKVDTKKKLTGERYNIVHAVHANLTGKVMVAYRYQQKAYSIRKYLK